MDAQLSRRELMQLGLGLGAGSLLHRPAPADPLAAVTHPDPYPCYAALVAARPFYRDDTLGLWVASGASVVAEVLRSGFLRVRPAAEPTPRALSGGAAGGIFGRLVRMNDGGRHDVLKEAIRTSLHGLDEARVAAASQRCARLLSDELQPSRDAARVSDFALRLPAYSVGSLLGVADSRLPQLSGWVADLAACFAPAADGSAIERGNLAAVHLPALFESLADAPPLRLAGIDSRAIAANSAGLLTQSYEATAGLVGNTLLALAAHPNVLARARVDRGVLRAAILETLRYDAPVQNTRRFAARGGMVAGQQVRDGDAVLVLLAAANRDPLANHAPDAFAIDRPDRLTFTFGAGSHACPGGTIAVAIAEAGVACLLRSGVDPVHLAHGVIGYRRSLSTRIPVFGSGGR